uniref:major histocompatibility complex class I-related gene protein-like n=1 Tax=Maylandia zebra TaxID=106582 RepID=UPI000D312737|nr:major histocompatibility complex class I-related gene protein-like [Maylandia zebra]
MKLCLLLIFCRSLFAVKHSLKYFVTGSSGVPNIPEFMGVLVFNGIQAGYCDSNNMTLKPKQDWAKKILQTSPEQKEWYDHMCFKEQPNFFKNMISHLKQFTKSEGVHVLQRIGGCERDENTGELTGLVHFGYNGEDFLEFNLETLTWIALKPEADLIRQEWDADRVRTKHNENFLTQICPEWLKTYVDSAKSPLQKSVLPSVSLVQKTPSSPVSCHATGFYPDRAVMFWRKDGEELHDGVDPGEILPNNDETFQMSVDLNVSSFTPEEWSRYDCAFQLSDGEDNIITSLNKTVIRTNWVENITKERSSHMMIIPAVVVSVVFFIIGFCVFKKKRERKSEQTSGNIYGLSERLNPEAP